MQEFLKKLKLIFLPYLILSMTYILIYTFLHWLFFIHFNFFSIHENVTVYILPYFLIWIPALLWLNPRIKLLNLNKKNRDYYFEYLLYACFSIAVCTILAQLLLIKSTGKITELNNIDEIILKKETKYYNINDLFLDIKNVGFNNTFEIDGKHNEIFNMYLFYTIPIISHSLDTSRFDKAKAWYGVEYFKTIRNSLSLEEKNIKFRKFLKESQKEFENLNYYNFYYLSKVGNNDDRKEYRKATLESKKDNYENQIILLPINEPYESRSKNIIFWFSIVYSVSIFIWFLMISLRKFDKKTLSQSKKGFKSPSIIFKNYIEYLKPKETFFVTPILIYINILIFIVMIFSGVGFFHFHPEDSIKWGGNYSSKTINGEWWRLITSIFLHGGFLHISYNMITLAIVGWFTELNLGRKKYLILYLSTGLISSVVSLIWNIDNNIVSIGASGAIYGLIGFHLPELLKNIINSKKDRNDSLSIIVMISFMLAIGYFTNSDNAAHLGGLISGAILSFEFKRKT